MKTCSSFPAPLPPYAIEGSEDREQQSANKEKKEEHPREIGECGKQ